MAPRNLVTKRSLNYARYYLIAGMIIATQKERDKGIVEIFNE